MISFNAKRAFLSFYSALSPLPPDYSPEVPSCPHRHPRRFLAQETPLASCPPHPFLTQPACLECYSVTAWPTPLIPTPSEHSGLVPLGTGVGHERASHKYQLQQLRHSPFPSVTECSSSRLVRSARVSQRTSHHHAAFRHASWVNLEFPIKQLQEIVKDKEVWCAVHGVAKGGTWLSDRTKARKLGCRLAMFWVNLLGTFLPSLQSEVQYCSEVLFLKTW